MGYVIRHDSLKSFVFSYFLRLIPNVFGKDRGDGTMKTC